MTFLPACLYRAIYCAIFTCVVLTGETDLLASPYKATISPVIPHFTLAATTAASKPFSCQLPETRSSCPARSEAVFLRMDVPLPQSVSKVRPGKTVTDSGLTIEGSPSYAVCIRRETERTEKSLSKGQGITWVTLKDGHSVEGVPRINRLTILMDGKPRTVSLRDILSVHIATAPSSQEQTRIQEDLVAVMGTDRSARDSAEADLTELGPVAISPLLASYKDTDLHEPTAHYRMFARLIPGYADALDRTLDLIRLTNGEVLRGSVQLSELTLVMADGNETIVSGTQIRRLAVRQKEVRKLFMVEALRHCTTVDFLDTGVGLTSGSDMEETAQGIVRLSFDIDGWATDADGVKVPGPHYTTTLVEGLPFGALIGRVGPKGTRWLAGRHISKSGRETGRLQLAVNDNDHWQNNIGSFRVRLHATNAYDLGDPQ